MKHMSVYITPRKKINLRLSDRHSTDIGLVPGILSALFESTQSKEYVMAKIAIIGAGSILFGTTLLNDLLQTEALEGSTYALMSPTMSKLKKVEDYTNKIIKKNNLKAEVYSTTDRRDALKDADYVVVVLQIGGMEAYKADYEIPLKYAC